MGCILSISSSSLSLPPEGTYYNSSDVAQFGLLGLDEDDLRAFSAIFYSFDPLGDCNISLHEFMPSLRLETNFVTSAIFDMMDSARDKRLSFGEFVLFSWNFLTMNGSEMEEFSFKIYDLDKTEQLRPAELGHLLGILHGKADMKDKVRSLLEVMDTGRSGTISKHEYMASVKKFPILVFPIFAIQDKMREGILGKPFWEKQMKTSAKLKRDKRVISLFHDAHNGKVPGRHHSQLKVLTKPVVSATPGSKADTRVSPVANISHMVPGNKDRRKSIDNPDESGKTSDTPERSPRRDSQGKGRRKSVGDADESGKTPRNNATPERSPRRDSQGKGRRKSVGNEDESGKTPRNNDTPERSPRRSSARPSDQSGVVRY